MKQNAMIAITTIDDNEKTILTYIPAYINEGSLDFFLKNSDCDNKEAIVYDLDVDADTFWKDTWDNMLETVED